MRPPRYRLRTLMLALILLAVLLNVAATGRRLVAYRTRADDSAGKEREWLILADQVDEKAAGLRTFAAKVRDSIEDLDAKADKGADRLAKQASVADDLADREVNYSDYARMHAEYFHLLNKKYEYAAFHPWLPVAPDLPEPE